MKKLKESIQDCTSALELDEKYFKAILRRAKSYMDLEMYDEAVRDYESANKMDRGNQEVRQLLQQAKLELKKSKRKDYYKMLGVGKDANDDEIKKAYRKRALVHHPGKIFNMKYKYIISIEHNTPTSKWTSYISINTTF